HESDARAVSVEIESGFRRRVFCADDDDILAMKRVGGDEAAVDVREVLAGDAELARVVKEAGGEDRRRRPVRPAGGAIGKLELQSIAWTRPDREDLGMRLDADTEALRHGPVVGEGVQARRVCVRTAEWNARDVQEIACREPAHLLGEVVDRVEEKSLVVAKSLDAEPLELDRTGDSRWTGADDRDGGRFAHGAILTFNSRDTNSYR